LGSREGGHKFGQAQGLLRDAMVVFSDPLALTTADPDCSIDEERWITIGLIYCIKSLLVVHTYVEFDADHAYVRIISARKPSKKEIRQHEQDT
jgi:uncharacterized protein